MPRKFGPKSADHPSIGEPCKLCGIVFKEGDYTTLMVTQPADEEERKKAEAGKAYTAAAVEVHWAHVQDILDDVAADAFEAR